MITLGLIFLQFFNTKLATAALQLLFNCFSVAKNFQGAEEGNGKKKSSLGA